MIRSIDPPRLPVDVAHLPPANGGVLLSGSSPPGRTPAQAMRYALRYSRLEGGQ